MFFPGKSPALAAFVASFFFAVAFFFASTSSSSSKSSSLFFRFKRVFSFFSFMGTSAAAATTQVFFYLGKQKKTDKNISKLLTGGRTKRSANDSTTSWVLRLFFSLSVALHFTTLLLLLLLLLLTRRYDSPRGNMFTRYENRSYIYSVPEEARSSRQPLHATQKKYAVAATIARNRCDIARTRSLSLSLSRVFEEEE